MKTTVLFHSADYDGIFCREIARKFLPDAELIGWDFGNPKVLMDIEMSLTIADALCANGKAAKAVIDKRNADTMKERSFLIDFEGLKFLACNFVRCNSKSFASRDTVTTGHDALMSFWWDGQQWTVSLYHAEHRKDIDLSLIATKLGGGGHRGACGFRAAKLPFIP